MYSLILTLSFAATPNAEAAPMVRRIMVEQNGSLTPNPDIVVNGDTNILMSAFDLSAYGEPMGITELNLVNPGAEGAVSLVTIEYTDSTGTVVTATASSVTGTFNFSWLDFPVPASGSSSLLVYADISSTADPGDTFSTDWTSEDIQAVGIWSGTAPIYVTDSVEGTEMIWHNTKPTLQLNSGSARDEIAHGASDVLSINASADSAADVLLSGMTFTIESTDNEGTDWNTCRELGNAFRWNLDEVDADGIALAIDYVSDWSFYSNAGVPCRFALNEPLGYANVSNLVEEIAAGTTNLIILELNTWCLSCTGVEDVLLIGVPSQDEADNVGPGINAVTWEDDSEPFDGTLIDDLPLIGNTLLLK
jgi:hypothetical protein